MITLVRVSLVEFEKVILVVVKAHGVVHAAEEHILAGIGGHTAETDGVNRPSVGHHGLDAATFNHIPEADVTIVGARGDQGGIRT